MWIYRPLDFVLLLFPVVSLLLVVHFSYCHTDYICPRGLSLRYSVYLRSGYRGIRTPQPSRLVCLRASVFESVDPNPLWDLEHAWHPFTVFCLSFCSVSILASSFDCS